MNKEKILRDISDLLKKNEAFFNNNPEFFYAVQSRLVKAISDDEPDEDEEFGYGDDMFDKPEDEDEDATDEDYEYVNPEGDDDEDEAARWLRENGEEPEYDPDSDESEVDPEADVDQGNYMQDDERQIADDEDPEDFEPAPAKTKDAKPEEKKLSASGYGEWKPKGSYEPHHEAKIKEHMANGYTHREAERLAGAHDAPTDFYSALKSKVKPSQPSAKMLEHMKGLSADWLKNAEKKIGERADAAKNPQKHASSKMISAHENALGGFTDAYDKFLGSDEVKGLKGRDRVKAINSWKQKYHEENPEHKENMIAAADAGKAYSTANDARKQHLEEGKQAILGAGMSGGEDNQMSGEYSQSAAGDIDGMDGQAAAQLVGGEKGEGGYSTNVQKDPAMSFAEKNPEYVKSLQTKLSANLKPDQAQRLSAVKSITKKGNQ